MRAFIVMQGRTYQQEKAAGLIWTEQRSSGQVIPPTWQRINQIQPQDILFHYVAGRIVAVSQALTAVRQVSRPSFLSAKVGPQVNVVSLKYYPLPQPLAITSVLADLKPLFPRKHAAFQQDGSGNQGYIYPCYSLLLAKLITLIEEQYFIAKQTEQLSLVMSAVTAVDNDPLMMLLVNAALLNQRQMIRTEQIFQRALLQRQPAHCAVCGLADPALLQASHLKPLKDSAPADRRNADNGVLLCPNHAALLAQGKISFSRGGWLLISPQLSQSDQQNLLLDPAIRVSFRPHAAPFLNWHRRYIFQK